jgi:hypothetical protein
MNNINRDTRLQVVDSEILQSMYRRKRNNRDNLNTKLFSEIDKEFRTYLLNSILLREDEELLVVSLTDQSQWLVLTNYGIHYCQNNSCDRIDYFDISKCSIGIEKMWKAGDYKAFIENTNLEITSNNGCEILLDIADTQLVNQTISDLINWASYKSKTVVLYREK